MSDLVDSNEIEAIVGHARAEHTHWGRMSTTDQKFYILHSRRCLESGVDLRLCEYSLALDTAFDPIEFEGLEDTPVPLELWCGVLLPADEEPEPSGPTVVGPVMPDRR